MSINLNQGFKAQKITVGVKNAEASVTMPAGSPVVLPMNGTNDGLDVVLPSTTASLKVVRALHYGVLTSALNVQQYGVAVVFGFTPTLLLQRQTRASSTDVWATQAALSAGDWLTIDTTNNRFITQATGGITVVTNATTDTVALERPQPLWAAAQTLASFASSASSTADTRTAITATIKAFVRVM